MKFVPRNGRAHDMAFSVGWFNFTDSSKRHMPLKNPSKAAQSVNWAKSSIRFLLGKHTHCNNVYSQSTVLGYNFLNIIDALEVFLRLHKAGALVTKDLRGNLRDHQVWSHFWGIKLDANGWVFFRDFPKKKMHWLWVGNTVDGRNPALPGDV